MKTLERSCPKYSSVSLLPEIQTIEEKLYMRFPSGVDFFGGRIG